MMPTPPLALRNRLAETILDALHDRCARGVLEALAEGAQAPGAETPEHAALVRQRARRASDALRALPLVSAEPWLEEALAAAAVLFDAGLHFEVHELLEPHWARARGEARDALQGLIQIAVGYQHLANGNLAGARALLDEGSRRLVDRGLAGLDLGPFAREVRDSIGKLPGLASASVPRFPRCA